MENSETKNVFILGGGAVGSVIAAALSQKPDIQLKLIGRKKHINNIKKNGLKIEGGMTGIFHFPCSEAVDIPLDHTLVILTTKATALHTALGMIAPYTRSSTEFLALQNGLGINDIITRHRGLKFNKNLLYRGIVGFGSTYLEPGIIRHWKGKLVVEEQFRESGFFNIFDNTFIDFFTTTDIKKRIWKKLIINSIYNPLSVLLKASNETISQQHINPLKKVLLEEGEAVAQSEGIKPEINLGELNRIVTSGNITSMLQDHLKGKKSEIDYINGAISKIGARNHIPTPINDFITHLIKSIEYIQKKNRSL